MGWGGLLRRSDCLPLQRKNPTALNPEGLHRPAELEVLALGMSWQGGRAGVASFTQCGHSAQGACNR